MKIRSALPDDAKRLLEIYEYYVANTAVSFEYDVPSEADFRNRIQNTLQKFPYLVLEEDGIIQGYAYAGMFKSRAAYSHSCEVSIYVDHNAKRRGYGRKLYEALKYLQGEKIVVAPSKAANAGGVLVSGLEMSQNSERYSWTAEEVDEKLKTIMTGIHDNSAAAAEQYGLGYNLIAGGNIVGFLKVAEAMMAQGIY